MIKFDSENIFYQTIFFIRGEEDSDSCYEISDQDVNKLLIVTQSPPPATSSHNVSTRPVKHDGFDRTGDWTPRAKMTSELAIVINDGLEAYEQDLKSEAEWVSLFRFFE